jgi:hypothetical protein
MSCVSWLQVQKYVTEHVETLIGRAAYISGTLNLWRHFTMFCICCVMKSAVVWGSVQYWTVWLPVYVDTTGAGVTSAHRHIILVVMPQNMPWDDSQFSTKGTVDGVRHSMVSTRSSDHLRDSWQFQAVSHCNTFCFSFVLHHDISWWANNKQLGQWWCPLRDLH